MKKTMSIETDYTDSVDLTWLGAARGAAKQRIIEIHTDRSALISFASSFYPHPCDVSNSSSNYELVLPRGT
jgi:hypothetical protein